MKIYASIIALLLALLWGKAAYDLWANRDDWGSPAFVSGLFGAAAFIIPLFN